MLVAMLAAGIASFHVYGMRCVVAKSTRLWTMSVTPYA